MKCKACGYDDQDPDQIKFFIIGDPIEGVVFGGKMMDRSLKTNLYACPECGTVKIIALGESNPSVD